MNSDRIIEILEQELRDNKKGKRDPIIRGMVERDLKTTIETIKNVVKRYSKLTEIYNE